MRPRSLTDLPTLFIQLEVRAKSGAKYLLTEGHRKRKPLLLTNRWLILASATVSYLLISSTSSISATSTIYLDELVTSGRLIPYPPLICEGNLSNALNLYKLISVASVDFVSGQVRRLSWIVMFFIVQLYSETFRIGRTAWKGGVSTLFKLFNSAFKIESVSY